MVIENNLIVYTEERSEGTFFKNLENITRLFFLVTKTSLSPQLQKNTNISYWGFLNLANNKFRIKYFSVIYKYEQKVNIHKLRSND